MALLSVAAVSATSVPSKTIDLVEANGYKLIDDSGITYNYTNGNDNLTILFMFDSELTLNDLQDGFEEKTINNTLGFYKEDEYGYHFNYNCDDDAVLIVSTDRGIIDKIVIGNDI